MRIISGAAKGRKLYAPRGGQVRPTIDWVKEGLFNILGPEVRGAAFLDLFAGSGGVGLEALSRGAGVTFVEKEPRALAALRKNLAHCAFRENFKVVPADVFGFIAYLNKSAPGGGGGFDFVFADPPYDGGCEDRLLKMLQGHCLREGGRLIVEHRGTKAPLWRTTAWEKSREARYGKTSLSFFVPSNPNN